MSGWSKLLVSRPALCSPRLHTYACIHSYHHGRVCREVSGSFYIDWLKAQKKNLTHLYSRHTANHQLREKKPRKSECVSDPRVCSEGWALAGRPPASSQRTNGKFRRLPVREVIVLSNTTNTNINHNLTQAHVTDTKPEIQLLVSEQLTSLEYDLSTAGTTVSWPRLVWWLLLRRSSQRLGCLTGVGFPGNAALLLGGRGVQVGGGGACGNVTSEGVISRDHGLERSLWED